MRDTQGSKDEDVQSPAARHDRVHGESWVGWPGKELMADRHSSSGRQTTEKDGTELRKQPVSSALRACSAPPNYKAAEAWPRV